MSLSQQSSAERRKSLFTRNFVLLILANFLMATSFYFLIPTLPIYFETYLGADKSSTGTVLAMFAIAALVIRPFAGFSLDRFGRRWIYLASLLFLSLLFPFYGFVYTLGLMAAFRFLHGLAWGVSSTAGATVVVDILPRERRGEGIGLFGLSMTLGMAMGPFAGLWLSKELSFEAMFMTGGALSLIGFALAAAVRVPGLQQLNVRRKFHEGLIEKSALPASLSVLLLIFAYGGLISFVSVYGKETGIGNPGIFFLIFAAGLGISRIVSGKIFDRSGPYAVTITGILMIIAGLPVLALFPGYAGYCSSAFLLGAGNGIMISTFQAMVNNLVGPEKRGAANSTLFTAFDLGIGGGMIATGILADMITLRGSFIFSTAVTVSGLLLYLVYVHPHYRKNILKTAKDHTTENKSVHENVTEPEEVSLEA